MYVSTQRPSFRLFSKIQRVVWLSLAAMLVLSSRMAVGQDDTAPLRSELLGMRAQGPDVHDAIEDGLFGEQFTGRSGQAFGAALRVGWNQGPAVGREYSIVPLEVMPYAFADKSLFFADLRGYRATRDGWGMNLGGGYRYYAERWDRILGVNAFYDYDNTSSFLFRQTGFGLELLGDAWDLRANAYFPMGVQERLSSASFVPGSSKFVGNTITFDQTRNLFSALTGMDMELGVPLPGRIATRHDVRLFGGWYYYEGKELDPFGGWKARLQGNVLSNLTAQVEVSNDHIFDTNVMFGVQYTFGGFRQDSGERKTQFNRMTEPVRRNYNVVVAKAAQADVGITAVDPSTGQPYFIEHVASYSPGPIFDGTIANPFLTIQDAQANPGGDIIYVHADSRYSTAPNNVVLLEPGVRILGEGRGVEHRLQIANIGTIPLPRATTFVNRPILEFGAGDAVRLASGTANRPSEFSGFQIGDPTNVASGPVGIGIIGVNVGNVVLSQNDINFAGGDGIFLQDVTGPVTIRGTVINDPTGTALHIVGGTGGVTFGDDLTSGTAGRIINSGGFALHIDGTQAGSFVNLLSADIQDGIGAVGGQGILIEDVDGNVTIGDATIVNSTGNGVNIQRGSGNITFAGALNINNPADDAIVIQDTLTGARVNFVSTNNTTSITARGGRGVYLLNNAGTVFFNNPLSIAGASAASAIEFQGNSGNAQFQTININGGGSGILIGDLVSDNTGTFTVLGTTTINGVTGTGISITDDDALVSFNGVNIGTRGGSGISVTASRGDIFFRGVTTVGNGASLEPAVDIQDNAVANVVFDTLQINAASRPFPLVGGAGLNVVNNPASVTVRTLNVGSAAAPITGIGVFARNAGVNTTDPARLGLTIGGGDIFVVGRQALDIQDSVIQLAFNSLTSTLSAEQGIRLVNNVGINPINTTTPSNTTLLQVTGNAAGLPGTGGAIRGALQDGILLQNTGTIELRSMIVSGNGGSGIFAETHGLDVGNMSITNNGDAGIETLNTPNVSIFSSQLSANLTNEIRLTSTVQTPTYTYTGFVYPDYRYNIGGITRALGNTISDINSDAVLVQNFGGGVGAILGLNFQNNVVSTTGLFGTSNLLLNWNGPYATTIDRNSFTFNNSGSRGVLINAISTSDPGSIVIQDNDFTSINGGGTVGIDITTSGGPTAVTIGSRPGTTTGNRMTFNSLGLAGDVGMLFTVGPNTNMNIFDNSIIMDGDLSQGMTFTQVQGPSTLTINNNLIDIDDGPDLVVDEAGITIFAASGSVTLFGSQNNDVVFYGGTRGAGVPFFFAPAGVAGSIIVNGVNVP